jgi:hypothetical protein
MLLDSGHVKLSLSGLEIRKPTLPSSPKPLFLFSKPERFPLITVPISGIVDLLKNPQAVEFAKVCDEMRAAAVCDDADDQTIVKIAAALAVYG